ncbi:MAG: hypothetical protein H7124_09310 [Phycisphaerales bacterium]|nr:hypothetical protein [Hyphomonadaceae bacterium]
MPLTEFFSGMVAMGYMVCTAFFLRFWWRTKDSLFFVFAIAFFLLALNSALATLLGGILEERSWLYLLRLAAFSILIVAIVGKNLGKR